MLYLKLVRDSVPALLQAKGVQCAVMQITSEDPGYEEMLIRKLEEEVAEFRREGNTQELADVIEVLHALQALPKHNEVEVLRNKKRETHGGFTKGFILISAV